MMKMILRGFLLLTAMGFIMGLMAPSVYALEALTLSEMDEIRAGFSLIDVSASVTTNANATTTCGDGAQCWSNTTGGGTGVASVPIYNGLTAKNIGGDAAVAHNGATATVDNSDNSDNSDQIHVDAGGDAAAAHSGGIATIDKSDNSVNTALSGAWSATGHGNSGDLLLANDSSSATVTHTLELTDNVQQNATAAFIVNTLGQVGNGFNLVSVMNSSGGGPIGNLNTGVIGIDQNIANFSNFTCCSKTISVAAAGAAVGTPGAGN